MRSLTGQDIAVLNAPDGYTVWARVWVWDGAGWQDVTSLEGRDWLVDVAWDESVNEPCAQATVQLRRRQEDLTLNPLVANKLTGVLALARPFYVEVATLPLGDPPAAGDWREVFRGQIEKLALDKDPITFTGRDDAGKLLRHFIEFEAEYGSDAGVAVQTVMQQILTDNGWPVTLYTPVSPGVVLSKYKQKKMATFAALRERALSIGWDVRMFWDNGTGAFRLTLLGPDRAGAAGSQWTFAPGQVKAVTQLEQGLADVRNAVRLYYYNRSALDSGGKPTRAYVDSSDATSIGTYGRLWMQLSEDEDSPVDSPAEAQRMADAAKDDLKDPLLDFGVEVGLHYGVQLGDLLTFEADNESFSSNQTLAVVSAAHRVGRKGHRTVLALRGKPVAAQDDWLRRESRAVRQPPAYTPDTLSGMLATPTTGGAVVTFSAPTVPPFPKEYELHVSTTSGFTPSASTLRERGNRTSFELTGLAPGTTYYAKVVPRTGGDEQGSASSQVTIAPRYVEPRTLQPYITYGVLPLNADFEARNDTSAPPDGWTAAGWGTAVTATTDSYSGSAAVVFSTGTGSASLGSQLFAARFGEELVISAWYKTGVSNTRCGTLIINWLSSPVAQIGSATVALGGTGVTAGTWTRAVTRSAAPIGAKYASVTIARDYSDAGTLTVDSTDVLRSAGRGEWVEVTYQNGWSAWNAAVFYVPAYRVDDRGEVQFRGLARASTPAPASFAAVFTLPTGCRPLQKLLFRVNTSAGPADLEIDASGVVVLGSITADGYLPLDGIRFQAEQ